MTKRLTALLFAFMLSLSAFADTFIVTSNADSGQGTLREAITMANANGTGTIDYIHFNIAELTFNARIINLVTELPDISSNIIIDGSTQPGESYAITDAKICIKKEDYAPVFSMLKIVNATNVEIYGLYLYYGYWQGLFYGSQFRSEALYGINLSNAFNVTIGAPTKGNVINGVVHGIYSNSDSCRNITIQSNYLSPGPFYTDVSNEISDVVLLSHCGITFAQVSDITIGGDQPQYGNKFGSANRGINIDSKYEQGNGLLVIQNNKFAMRFDSLFVSVSDLWDNYIHIGRSRNNPADYSSQHHIDYKILLLDNDIPNHMFITYVSDSVIVKRNRFITDDRNTSLMLPKLTITNSPGGGIIGDSDIINGNSFKKRQPGESMPSLYIVYSGPFTVLKNTFECNSVYGSTTNIWNHSNTIPYIQIDSTTNDFVEGRATPNTRVDLYYDDECTACEGEIYFATVAADNLGNWKYNGPVTGTVVAIATSDKGYSSEFSMPVFNESQKKIKHPTCGKSNGSITGITTEGAETYFWVEFYTKDTISHSIDLVNAGPGTYMLHAVHGGTCINRAGTFYLEDQTPLIRKDWMTIIQPSCGQANGSLRDISVLDGQQSVYKWVNSQGDSIGSDLNLFGLSEGIYTFIVTDTTKEGGCSFSETFTLTNQSGPTLITNNVQITPATCGNNTGSIKGITFTGAQGGTSFQWVDSINNIAGYDIDLVNAYPGKYRLQFKDDGGCETITTSYYTIGNTGELVIDTTGMNVSPSKCSGITGAISNLKVTGGDHYEWRNMSSNAVVANSLDVFNLPGGYYQLTVTNNSGCNKTSPVIHVPQAKFQSLGMNSFISKIAFCGKANGSLEPEFTSGDTSYYRFRWVDSATNQTISNYTKAFNIYGGTYMLYEKDSNDCEAVIHHTVLRNAPIPSFDYSNMIVTPDNCLEGKGSINGIKVYNLFNDKNQYTWLNNANNAVGNTTTVKNLTANDYQLRVTDDMGCTVMSKPITVNNVNTGLPNPLYDDITILRNTAAELKVKNMQQGLYELYDNPSAPMIASNSTGIFTTSNLSTDKTYYIRFVSGVCSSDAVPVKVMVADKTIVYIPTAFTPNQDGKNDVFRLIPYGAVTLQYFTIYNRWGKVVFNTTSFNNAWDGTFNGQILDAGVFVWVMKAIDNLTGQIIEQKGTVTMIR